MAPQREVTPCEGGLNGVEKYQYELYLEQKTKKKHSENTADAIHVTY
jgi:hypothetical protein